jgi:hypothetical protein
MSASTPTCFEFRLVVSGLDLDDADGLNSLISAFDDDASVGGTTTDLAEVLITAAGDDPIATVHRAVATLLKHVPGAAVDRLDEDLVGISDIAQLAGKTRESIRLYADGKRGRGGFPPPMGVVGDSVRVWRWSDVDPWLRENVDFAFPTRPVPSWAIDQINASLRSVDQSIDQAKATGRVRPRVAKAPSRRSSSRSARSA